jgi:hypothetical protein
MSSRTSKIAGLSENKLSKKGNYTLSHTTGTENQQPSGNKLKMKDTIMEDIVLEDDSMDGFGFKKAPVQDDDFDEQMRKALEESNKTYAQEQNSIREYNVN